MFIREALSTYAMPETGFLDSEVLLSYVLGKKRDFLVAHGDEVVSEDLWQRFVALWKERRRGVPLAYLIKEKEFYGLPFYVDERVLIPRPETELLIEIALNVKCQMSNVKCAERRKKLNIIDVGTGSGCISLTLAKLWPDILMTATDVSKEALVVAQINAERYGLEKRILFKQSDLLTAVKDEYFDIIVANLPYIGTEQYNYVEPEVRKFEPKQALFGGKDGLELYRRLFEQIATLPIKPRFVIGEFGFGQGDEVRSMIQSYFSETELDIKRDLAGIERAFILKFPPLYSGEG